MKTWCYQIDHFPSPMFEYFLIQLRFVTVEHDSWEKYEIISCNPLAPALCSLYALCSSKIKTIEILKLFLKQFTRKGVFNNFNYSIMHRNQHIQPFSFLYSKKSPCPGDWFKKNMFYAPRCWFWWSLSRFFWRGKVFFLPYQCVFFRFWESEPKFF